jgi:hypothetical protein
MECEVVEVLDLDPWLILLPLVSLIYLLSSTLSTFSLLFLLSPSYSSFQRERVDEGNEESGRVSGAKGQGLGSASISC